MSKTYRSHLSALAVMASLLAAVPALADGGDRVPPANDPVAERVVGPVIDPVVTSSTPSSMFGDRMQATGDGAEPRRPATDFPAAPFSMGGGVWM
jgi:hypothetical protein